LLVHLAVLASIAPQWAKDHPRLAGREAVLSASAALILLPLYFSTVLGYSGIELSLAITPVAACFMIGAPTSGRLMSMVGSDVVVRFAVGAAVAGAIALALGAMMQSYVWMLPGLILTGLGLSSATSPVTTTAIHEAPHDRIGVAAALPNVARYSGGALGGALRRTARPFGVQLP
jgi:MFS family permease